MSLSRAVIAAVALLASAAAGCTTHPPPNWAQGGSGTALGRARWERGGDTIDLLPDGRVLVDGDALWTIDAAGRITDEGRAPYAVLFADGRLIGTDDQPLGVVGAMNASPPGSGAAWLTVAPSGEVILYDPEGARAMGGAWSGCQGPISRTCTLVTHLVVTRDVQRRPRVGIGFGVGIGIRR
jgi:hypothetical protein